jgi:hypothetical protein
VNSVLRFFVVVAGIGFKGICVGYQWQQHFQLEETHCFKDMQVVVKSPSERRFFSLGSVLSSVCLQ